MQWSKAVMITLVSSIFAAAPTSTNYTLQNYDFGTGGGAGSSTSYNLHGNTNGANGPAGTSTTYKAAPGLAATIDKNVPIALLTNPDGSNNRLHLTIDPQNNPSDTKYAIAISIDNFTSTQYVQSDNSVGTVLGSEDRQTYAAWGGASGFWIVGLAQNTSYSVKIKAMQGNYTESTYGPVASAVTAVLSLSFSVATTLTSTPPFNVSFSSITPGSVYSANADSSLSLSTNAQFGGSIYAYGQQSGLHSSTRSYTLNSTTADLSSAASGYGAQVTTASQASGGPLSAIAPYNGVSNNVGVISTTIQSILSTPAPITNGSATVRFKAKTDYTAPSATDYTDTITFVAAMNY
jgi:hypothetical protein